MPYKVIDRKTGTLMGTYGTSKGAHRKAESLNQDYGAHRYGVDIQAIKKKSTKKRDDNGKFVKADES